MLVCYGCFRFFFLLLALQQCLSAYGDPSCHQNTESKTKEEKLVNIRARLEATAPGLCQLGHWPCMGLCGLSALKFSVMKQNLQVLCASCRIHKVQSCPPLSSCHLQSHHSGETHSASVHLKENRTVSFINPGFHEYISFFVQSR